ncbi:MAG: diguanylate cyclase and metal dependent phosphohydrolase [Firmicutes bacterium]|nr:diguanylate cyclase and metal dependent phosphohydrolase [Bacillota bacterium]
MKGKDKRSETTGSSAKSWQVLRLRAEKMAKEKTAQSPKKLEAISPEEMQQTLHELRVHQIELEIQNEELRRAQAELDIVSARYFDLYDRAPIGYCTISEKGLIVEANLTAAKLLGVFRGELIERPLSQFIFREDQDIYYVRRKKIFETGETYAFELRMVKSDETVFWAHLETAATKNTDGGTVCRIMLGDITERKKLETALANEKKLLETTLASIGDGVISTDNKGNIVYFNRVAEIFTGWTQETAKGKSLDEVLNTVNASTREKNESIAKKVLQGEKVHQLVSHTILIAKNGTERPVEDRVAPILQENEEIRGVVLVVRDFSEQKKKQEKIEYLSYHDQLTGLYNRRFYLEELKRLDTERNLPMTIVMADVNGLKLINDSLGHAMGDRLLKKVAEVITKGCRDDDIIARLGGDEFVIILPKTDAYKTMQIIKRIKALSLKEKVGFIDISISFGYETKHKKEENVQEVFKKAEDYMYKNKLFESPSLRGKTIRTIITTLQEKSKIEEQHARRVSSLCESMAEALELGEYEIKKIKSAGLLHDIGKIAVDEKILNKPGKLSEAEWKEMRRHPKIGCNLLKMVNDMSEIAEYVLAHHERWDGQGYPKGLKDNEIPFVSRILIIADAYDDMTSGRNYRSVLADEAAVEELRKNAGIQFDPELVNVFIEKVLGENKSNPDLISLFDKYKE